MEYRIQHTTRYTYTEPVPTCHNQVHLAPRTTTTQSCREFHLLLSPAPVERQRRVDFWGNWVDYFSLHEAHQGMTVTASSIVDVFERPDMRDRTTPRWESMVADVAQAARPTTLEAFPLRWASTHVPLGKEFAAYARPSFPTNRPVLDALLDLTRRIHSEFRYDPTATSVNTPVREVLQLRAGVCQDFAHFQLACLRSLGIAARYVSGYLRTIPPPGKQRLVGADASHAWISVFCGDEAGWIDFDPTNNTIPGIDHITIGWGRDYADVCPIQGVVLGGGQHGMAVSVDVEQLAT